MKRPVLTMIAVAVIMMINTLCHKEAEAKSFNVKEAQNAQLIAFFNKSAFQSSQTAQDFQKNYCPHLYKKTHSELIINEWHEEAICVTGGI